MKKKSFSEVMKRVTVYTILIVSAVFVAFPFYWMIMTTVTPATEAYSVQIRLFPSRVDFSMYSKLLSDPFMPIDRFFLNSVIISVGSTVVNVLTAIMASYALARRKLVGGTIFYYLIIATMMVPGEVVLIGLYLLVNSMKLLNTHIGMILPLSVNAVNFLIIYNYMLTLPKELDEAAFVDGAKPGQVMWLITLPLSLPAIYSAALLGFLSAWQNFTIPYLLASTNDMYPLSVGALFTENTLFVTRQETLTLATMLTLPTLLVFIFTQRFVFSGITAGAIKG